jgi:hypothetical protein
LPVDHRKETPEVGTNALANKVAWGLEQVINAGGGKLNTGAVVSKATKAKEVAEQPFAVFVAKTV